MPQCQKCNSVRIMVMGAKCSDLFNASISDKTHCGYVLNDIGIGGGDYVSIDYCLDCGQIQGTFPVPLHPLEQGMVYKRGEWIEKEDDDR